MTTCEVALADCSRPVEVPEWEVVWGTLERKVGLFTRSAANAYQVSERDLSIAIRLHLPRFSLSQLEDESVLRREVVRIAARMRGLRSGVESRNLCFGNLHPGELSLKRDAARFELVERGVAQVIHERFHYVGSFREGLHFGLFNNGTSSVNCALPMALATLSVLDVKHLQALMERGGCGAEAMILSRVYCFEHAPRNCISYLLGRISNWLRGNLPDVRILFTYVNPNLGFSGVSYRASNWKEVGEKAISYRYLGENYASARQCETIGAPVGWASYRLLPLKIWSYVISD